VARDLSAQLIKLPLLKTITSLKSGALKVPHFNLFITKERRVMTTLIKLYNVNKMIKGHDIEVIQSEVKSA